MSNWASLASAFAESKKVTKVIAGKDVNFYPVSSDMLFKLKSVIQRSAVTYSQIQQGGQNLNTEVTRDTKQDGLEVTEYVKESPLASLFSAHSDLVSNAWKCLIEELLGNSGQQLIAEIIMDSMRDAFPRNNKLDRPSAKEFFESIPSVVLPLIVQGVAMAHKEILGDMAGKLQDAVKETMSGMTAGQNSSDSSLNTPDSSVSA